MADPNGPIASVKCNGSVAKVHKGPHGKFLMTNKGKVLRKAQWSVNNDPTDVWMDIENCDLPRDLDPKRMYDCIKAGLKEHNYT
ncbi:unnamed protein product, partial [Brassica oleracea]